MFLNWITDVISGEYLFLLFSVGFHLENLSRFQNNIVMNFEIGFSLTHDYKKFYQEFCFVDNPLILINIIKGPTE